MLSSPLHQMARQQATGWIFTKDSTPSLFHHPHFPLTMPPFIPPSQFSLINEGLYSGAYPETINYPFLESFPLLISPHHYSLHLKCIVSMIPERAPEEVVRFCQQQDIIHIHIDTDEYDIDCIPSKEEKRRVISVPPLLRLSFSI